MPAGSAIDSSRAAADWTADVVVATTVPVPLSRSARTTYPVTGDPFAAAGPQNAFAVTAPPAVPDEAVTVVGRPGRPGVVAAFDAAEYGEVPIALTAADVDDPYRTEIHWPPLASTWFRSASPALSRRGFSTT